MTDTVTEALQRLIVAARKINDDFITNEAEDLQVYIVQYIKSRSALPPQYISEKVLMRAINNQTAVVYSDLRGTLLTRFPHRQADNGYNVNITRGRSSFFKKAFVINVKNAGPIMLQRDQNKKLKTLYGPSPSQVMKWSLPDIVKYAQRKVVDDAIKLISTNTVRGK